MRAPVRGERRGSLLEGLAPVGRAPGVAPDAPAVGLIAAVLPARGRAASASPDQPPLSRPLSTRRTASRSCAPCRRHIRTRCGGWSSTSGWFSSTAQRGSARLEGPRGASSRSGLLGPGGGDAGQVGRALPGDGLRVLRARQARRAAGKPADGPGRGGVALRADPQLPGTQLQRARHALPGAVRPKDPQGDALPRGALLAADAAPARAAREACRHLNPPQSPAARGARSATSPTHCPHAPVAPSRPRARDPMRARSSRTIRRGSTPRSASPRMPTRGGHRLAPLRPAGLLCSGVAHKLAAADGEKPPHLLRGTRTVYYSAKP